MGVGAVRPGAAAHGSGESQTPRCVARCVSSPCTLAFGASEVGGQQRGPGADTTTHYRLHALQTTTVRYTTLVCNLCSKGLDIPLLAKGGGVTAEKKLECAMRPNVHPTILVRGFFPGQLHSMPWNDRTQLLDPLTTAAASRIAPSRNPRKAVESKALGQYTSSTSRT